MDDQARLIKNKIDLKLKIYRGSDIGSDHCHLVGVFKMNMKKVTTEKHHANIKENDDDKVDIDLTT